MTVAFRVLDASALLAFLQGEPGADEVEAVLGPEAVCSAATWSETAQKVLGRGASWMTAAGLLRDYGLTVESVTTVDAERAAHRWSDAPHLSLGDRLCLALADRLEADVWTADVAWGTSDRVHQIRLSPGRSSPPSP